ncbi:MAG: alpha/beta hydrolase, partial [Gordonia sp. (in: high G+C Gram-positive bacteria)]
MDVTYEGTKREIGTDAGVIRYHEAGEEHDDVLILLHG